MIRPVIVWGVYKNRVLGSISSKAGCKSSLLGRLDTGGFGGRGGSFALPRLESAAMSFRA